MSSENNNNAPAAAPKAPRNPNDPRRDNSVLRYDKESI